jgi:hypothetical protein
VAFTPGASELLQLLGAYPAGDSMPHRILNEGVAASLFRVVESQPQVAIAMAVLEVFLLLVYMLAVRGCFEHGSRRLGVITVVAIACYFLLISGGAQAVGRYRMPVMPLLCVLAAGSLSICWSKIKRDHDGPAG